MSDDLQHHKTDVFSLALPAHWQVLRQEHAALRLGEFESERVTQGPYFSVSLGRFADVNELGADQSLEQRLGAYCAGFETKIIQTDQRQIKDVEVIYIQQRNDTAFNNRPIKTTFHNAFLLLNDTVFLDVELVYETDQAALFDGLFTQLLESLVFSRDETELNAAIERSEEAHKEQNKAMHAKLRDENAEAKKQRYETYLFTPPSDGCFTAHIGGLAFDLLPNTLNWQIAKHARGLSLEFSLKPEDEKKANDAKLVSGSSHPPNAVTIKLHCNEVYAPSGPSGGLRMVDGKISGQNNMRVDLNLAQTRLRFNGFVYFREGWLGLIGDLYASYDNLRDAVPITVYTKWPDAPLDWSEYQFTLAEAKSAPVDIVRHLKAPITDRAIDPAIWQMTELRHLHITGAKPGIYPHQPARLTELPSAISHLTKLENLGIVHTTLTTLPDEIGNLKQLRRLNFRENALETVPDALFQLPKLEWLSLSHNAIKTLPAHIDLPELKSLDLGHNQLSEIPEAYALQPRINTVQLTNNSLRALPEAFHPLKTGLSITDRLRLMDWRYAGADGKGLAVWEDTAFLASGDKALQQSVHNAISGTVLEPHQDALDRLALRTVWLETTTPDAYSAIGNTRLGGLPDLPASLQHPVFTPANCDDGTQHYHYEFIAQLNCEELAPFQTFLPRNGMLYFFIKDEESFTPKVLYHPTNTDLNPAKTIDASKITYFDQGDTFTPYRVRPAIAATLPDFYRVNYWIETSTDPDPVALIGNGQQATVYEGIREELNKRLNDDNPDRQNHLTHAINGFVFTQHEDPREQAALRYKGRPEDWVVLLKVASDYKIGFQFWDAGDLFFVIHKSDLAKQDFNQIYCSIESS